MKVIAQNKKNKMQSLYISKAIYSSLVSDKNELSQIK